MGLRSLVSTECNIIRSSCKVVQSCVISLNQLFLKLSAVALTNSSFKEGVQTLTSRNIQQQWWEPGQPGIHQTQKAICKRHHQRPSLNTASNQNWSSSIQANTYLAINQIPIQRLQYVHPKRLTSYLRFPTEAPTWQMEVASRCRWAHHHLSWQGVQKELRKPSKRSLLWTQVGFSKKNP